MKRYHVIVTGDREDWSQVPVGGMDVQWQSVPVLDFEPLPVPEALLERIAQKPMEWIVFTSPRAVRFWSQALLAAGYELPVETRVACLGERTAEVAAHDGYTVDFCPREPGTDGFLEEFESVGPSASGGTVLIPAAEGGRPKLKERLKARGFEVTWLPLYRTLPKTDLGTAITTQQWAAANAVVFTSPSSVDALLDCVSVPDHVQVLAIGGFTGRHLESRGYIRPRLLPEGDFARIGEVLF